MVSHLTKRYDLAHDQRSIGMPLVILSNAEPSVGTTPPQYFKLQCSMFQLNTNQTTPRQASAIKLSPRRLHSQR